MQQDFRFCFQGCCRLLNGHAVSRDQYEASIPKTFYRLGRPLFLTAELGHVSGKQQRMTSRNGKRLGNSRWSS